MDLKIKSKDLAEGARKLSSTLVKIPFYSLSELFKYMSPRVGITGESVQAELVGNVGIGPYNSKKSGGDADLEIVGRVLKNYLGNCAFDFDPNTVVESVYSAGIVKGKALQQSDIVKEVLAYCTSKIGEELYYAVWNGVRNAGGKNTVDLFDGFDTITAKEIKAGTISATLGNLQILTEAITAVNAEDVLKGIYAKCDSKLRGVDTVMFVSDSVRRAYLEAYKASGTVIYNGKYEQIFLEGSSGRCEIVALPNKDGSDFIQITPKSNMLLAFNHHSSEEKVEIKDIKEFLLTFIMVMYFGVNFQSIRKEKLMVVQLKKEGE